MAGSQTGSGTGSGNGVNSQMNGSTGARSGSTSDATGIPGSTVATSTGSDMNTNLASREPYRDQDHNFGWVGLLGLVGLGGLMRRSRQVDTHSVPRA
jgi:MYXO-CTERM domain-containing protein